MNIVCYSLYKSYFSDSYHLVRALIMKNALINIWNFYLEGFRSMTLGRTLWLIILVKLFIMFFILRLFFFPNFLGHLPTEEKKSEYVGNELIRRAVPLPD